MASLESRTIDSKREMDILDKLQEIRGRNARLERADADKVLERISSRRDPILMDEEERIAELKRLKDEDEDEELVRKYFAKGVVPSSSIELEGEDAEGATGDVDGLGDDGNPNDRLGDGEEEDVDAPVAGPSGTSGDSNNASPVHNGANGTSPKPTASSSASHSNGNGTTTIKRKLVEIEPDAVSLLSEEARKIVESASFKTPPLPPKKKKTNGSSLLGIKLKKR